MSDGDDDARVPRDARFEDGESQPLRLAALTPDDLSVISALVQDAVFPATELKYDRRARRFALLLNRFRWEDRSDTPERVQAVLVFQNVTRVQTQGVERAGADDVLSLLSIAMDDAAADDRVILTLAGDGAIALDTTALDVTLRDVTRPYHAVAGKAPSHPD